MNATKKIIVETDNEEIGNRLRILEREFQELSIDTIKQNIWKLHAFNEELKQQQADNLHQINCLTCEVLKLRQQIEGQHITLSALHFLVTERKSKKVE